MQKSTREQLFLETKLSSILTLTPELTPERPPSLFAACFSWECPNPSPLCLEQGYLSLTRILVRRRVILPLVGRAYWGSLRPLHVVREHILWWQGVLRTGRFRSRARPSKEKGGVWNTVQRPSLSLKSILLIPRPFIWFYVKDRQLEHGFPEQQALWLLLLNIVQIHLIWKWCFRQLGR